MDVAQVIVNHASFPAPRLLSLPPPSPSLHPLSSTPSVPIQHFPLPSRDYVDHARPPSRQKDPSQSLHLSEELADRFAGGREVMTPEASTLNGHRGLLHSHMVVVIIIAL